MLLNRINMTISCPSHTSWHCDHTGDNSLITKDTTTSIQIRNVAQSSSNFTSTVLEPAITDLYI